MKRPFIGLDRENQKKSNLIRIIKMDIENQYPNIANITHVLLFHAWRGCDFCYVLSTFTLG